jgi:hypothetical protein
LNRKFSAILGGVKGNEVDIKLYSLDKYVHYFSLLGTESKKDTFIKRQGDYCINSSGNLF